MRWCPKQLTDSHGSMAVVVAVSLTMLLVFGALSIDIGRALVVKNELRNVADAGALAGARQLGQSLFYQNPALGVLQDVSPLQGPVLNSAQTIAQQNNAEGVSIAIPAGDILIGQWNEAAMTLTPTGTNPDAVQVTAGRDGSPNPPLLPFLAGIVGVNTMNVTAQAAARLSATSQTAAGELSPFVISVGPAPAVCDTPVSYPGGNLGMTTFNAPSPNPITDPDGTLRAKAVNDLIPPDPANPVLSPGTSAGQSTVNLVFAADFVPVPANAITRFPVGSHILVPVVSGNVNNGGASSISGYALVRINDISSGFTISGTVSCNRTAGQRGGNTSDFGTNGQIPALVL